MSSKPKRLVEVDGKLQLLCTKCGKVKEATSENRQKKKNGVLGFGTWCKSCMSEYAKNNKEIYKRYYYDNKEYVDNRNKEYNKKHKEEIVNQRQQHYIDNKEEILEKHRKYYKDNRDSYIKNIRGIMDKHSNELGFNWGTFHSKTYKFVKDNGLNPNKCSICGSNENIEIHHPYYNSFDDWSIVVFCCKTCHRRIHSGTIKCPTPINLLDS